MVDGISPEQLTPIGPLGPTTPARPTEHVTGEMDFAAQLRRQLEQVSQMQKEADQGIEHLLTGQTDNITDVFVAARKAEVAFSLLMEIRNKLVDAYAEMRQMRV
jgi:flagellar hook-basal body complex protein FliE